MAGKGQERAFWSDRNTQHRDHASIKLIEL